MIRTPNEFSPLLHRLVDCFCKLDTVRRIVFFFAVAMLTAIVRA